MTAGPKLKWEPSEPITRFPGEFECRVGCIHFSVATAGQWDISTVAIGGHRMIIIDCGDSKNLASAKRKCQQWLDRQWKAMETLKGDAGQ